MYCGVLLYALLSTFCVFPIHQIDIQFADLLYEPGTLRHSDKGCLSISYIFIGVYKAAICHR